MRRSFTETESAQAKSPTVCFRLVRGIEKHSRYSDDGRPASISGLGSTSSTPHPIGPTLIRFLLPLSPLLPPLPIQPSVFLFSSPTRDFPGDSPSWSGHVNNKTRWRRGRQTEAAEFRADGIVVICTLYQCFNYPTSRAAIHQPHMLAIIVTGPIDRQHQAAASSPGRSSS